ncbi:hypothetical protein [Sediminicoccus sp. BL-A-41-H5]|uniref:hypothetical protein n=1 Tax=Sediminicoccus sp. BL-A-41-H5 TaxID=3421106 RepID=UPI003D67C523
MPTLLSIEALQADRLYVEQQLLAASANPWGTSRLMWENRLAEIDEQMRASSLTRANHASVALIFDGNPVIGSGDIRLDFTTQALDSYQKIVSLSLASALSEALPLRGRLPGADLSRLFIRDIVRGSMGFILEEVLPDQTELVETRLKDALERSTELISVLSRAEEDEFAHTIEKTPARLVAAVQGFAKLLRDSGASTKIFGDMNKVELSLEDVRRLTDRLNEIEVKEELAPIVGILLGVLPDSREFELRLPDGEGNILRGSVSEDLAFKYTSDTAFKDKLLLQPVRAHINTVSTFRNGRLVKERRVLEALEAAPQDGLLLPGR